MKSIKYLLFLTIFCLLFISCNKKETEIKGDIFIVTQGAENYKMGLIQVTAIPEEIIRPHIESKRSRELSQVLVEYNSAKEKVEDINANLALENKAIKEVFSSISRNSSISELRGALSNERWHQIRILDVKNSLKSAEATLQSVTNKLNMESGAERYFENLPLGVAMATSDADGKFNMKLPKDGKYALAANAERKVGDKTEKYYWLFLINADGSESKSIILSNNNLTDSGSVDSLIQTAEY